MAVHLDKELIFGNLDEVHADLIIQARKGVWNIVHDCMVSTFPWRAGMAIFCMFWIS